jgi:ATP-dependent helicase HrpA
VIAGETGSGKTTQLPKICLQMGLGESGMVGHTQPRRLAARTVSMRIADELNVVHGQEVGYAVRFTDKVADNTLIKVMTDGILLTEIRRDRWLSKYDAIIVDEAHERSLNIDFLLGVLRRILDKRPEFKVVVTSATIDVQRFSEFFNNAPIIEVGGRTYPVEVVHEPAGEDLAEGIGDVLDDIETRPHQGASDVLVFLTGEREIFEVAKALRHRFTERLEILPLYARLSVAEQQKVFQTSSSKRRVVLATNVAETSITVPNIGFVIDPGFVRINRYSYRSKLQRLPIEPISQASADQRKGRCGRIAPGTCFRLYDEQDYLSRQPFTDPEIRRVNLASVVLQMHAFNLGDIRHFPFVDPPEPAAIKDAMRLLDELGAVSEGKLTKVGRSMARLPVDPRLARMLIEADRQGALAEMLIIVSGLSVQDPRERPMQKSQSADQSHTEFSDDKSDFVSWLKLWDWLEEQRQELTNSRFRRLLQRRFVHPMRVREWREVHRQLRLVCKDLGFKPSDQKAKYAAIHESVVAGSLSLIALHDEKGHYQGARNLKLRIFPGSGVTNSPKWIVAAEIAETARVYGRCVAQVEPAWIERQGAHLVKRQFAEPHWSEKRGEVLARLNVSLYGLRLAENRLVGYAQEDPDLCRELFIRDGLVTGAVSNAPDFLQANLKLVRELQEMEAKGRRRDLLINDDEIGAFYDALLPKGISKVSDLRHWCKGGNEQALYMTSEFLTRRDTDRQSAEDFPAELTLDGLKLKLSYRFAPGEIDDGISVALPIGLLPGVSNEHLEWSVPGFFPLIIDQWLRSLPKAKRKGLAPMPDKVEEISSHLLHPDRYRKGRLLSALKMLLADWYRVKVDEQDWARERVAPHLLMNLKVLDEQRQVLRQSRHLSELKTRFSASASDQSEAAAGKFVAVNLTVLPDGKLKDYVLVGSKRAPVMKFPGLVDRVSHVDLELFEDRQTRDRQHRVALSRVVLLKLGKGSRYFRKELDKHPLLGLQFATLGSADDLKHELLSNIVWYCFLDGRPLPSTQAALDQRISDCRPKLADIFTQTVDVFADILKLRFECTQLIDGYASRGYAESRADAEMHLERLAPADVLSQTPWRHLFLKPRYLEGLRRRLEHLAGHVPQDLKRVNDIKPLEQMRSSMPDAELYDEDLGEELMVLCEELRLSIFAEPLARQKVVNHPLNSGRVSQPWKASLKKVKEALEAETARLGLA